MDEDNGPPKNSKESEADKFAADRLVPIAAWTSFVNAGFFNAASVAQFAAQVGIAAGVVVGRLQHERRVAYAHLNQLKRAVPPDECLDV